MQNFSRKRVHKSIRRENSDSYLLSYYLIHRHYHKNRTATFECWPRYADVTKPDAEQFEGCFVNESLFLDYWLYADGEDTWTYQDKTYTNQWAPIFRWRTDFQNDFAARMDWCVQPVDEANHPPIVALEDDFSTKVTYVDVEPGEQLSFSAANSYDSDGDKLSYQWWIYPEAGTYEGDVFLKNAEKARVRFKVPDDLKDQTIHLILTVRDNGIPQLTRYRRVVISGKGK